MKWISLKDAKDSNGRDLGLAVIPLKLPSGRHCMVFVNGDKVADKVKQIGFGRSAKGYWVRDDLKFSGADLKLFRDLFRNVDGTEGMQLVEVDAAKLIRQLAPKDQPRPDIDMAQARRLGLNRMGWEVFEGTDERFAKEKGGRIHRESDNGAAAGLFLRAIEDADLHSCAEGFVEEIVQGRNLKRDDLISFARVVSPKALADDAAVDPQWVESCRRAVDQAMMRRVTSAGHDGVKAAFDAANRLHEGHPPLFSTSPAITMPVSVVLQRVIGFDANRTDPTIGLVARRPEALSSVLNPAIQRHTDRLDTDYQMVAVHQGLWLENAPDATLVNEALEARKADGRSVFLLDPADGETYARLVATCHVEGVADLDGSMAGAPAGTRSLRVVAIGPKRVAPLAAEQLDAALGDIKVRQVNDQRTLWGWSNDVIGNRAKALRAAEDELIDARVAIEGVTGEISALTPEERRLRGNEFQAPYVSASQVGQPTANVPRFLESASREALSNLTSWVHSQGFLTVDHFVAHEMGWTLEELGDGRLTPEQVDGAALMFMAQDKGHPFMLGDMTGQGKGRVMACGLVRSVRKGEKPFFITEKANLFSDIMRDLKAIGCADIISPMILNADAVVVDQETGEPIVTPPAKADMDQILADGGIPPEYNCVFGTYSQFNKPAERITMKRSGRVIEPSAKSKWLLATANENNRFFLDEAHNITSKTAKAAVNIRDAIAQSKGGAYASATFAKDARAIATFADLFPSVVQEMDLDRVLSRGGEVLQEVNCEMMVRDGRARILQHDLSRCEFVTLEDAGRKEVYDTYMGTLAPILSTMAFISGEVETIIGRLNRQVQERLRNIPENQRRRQGIQFRSASIGGSLFKLSRAFLTSLKADFMVERAVNAINSNEKPVILLESTMEDYLREAQGEADLDNGVLDGVAMPDYKSLLRREVDRLTLIRRENVANNDAENLDVMQEGALGRAGAHIVTTEVRDGLAEARTQLLEMIERMPALPLSVIDHVRNSLTEAGYSCGEITGRKLRLNQGRLERIPGARTARANEEARKFNCGEHDALIINTAGCTGISLHAGANKKIFKDQRPRVLIKPQFMLDINDDMQANGRVWRLDQVNEPRIEVLSSGDWSETRLSAMYNGKLRRLSANTTSNRDNAALMDDIPDILNMVGNKVCRTILAERPDIVRRLALPPIGEQDSEEQQVQNYYADRLLSRLIMLPPAERAMLGEDVMAEYKAVIAELDAKGENPLHARRMAGVWEEEESRVFEGAVDDALDQSCYNEAVNLVQLRGTKVVQPLRREAVSRMIDQGSMELGLNTMETALSRIAAARNMRLREMCPPEFATVEAALEANHESMTIVARRYDRLVQLLGQVRPGTEITITHPEMDEPVAGLVTKVMVPKADKETYAQHWTLEFVLPGDDKPMRQHLGALMDDPDFWITPGLHSDDYEAYEEILANFDAAPAGPRTFMRKALTGNMLRATHYAMSHKIGTPSLYYDADGVAHRCVLINRQSERKMNLLPIKLPNLACLIDYVKKQRPNSEEKAMCRLYGSEQFKTQDVTVVFHANGTKELQLPVAGGFEAPFWAHPDLKAMAHEAAAENRIRLGRPYFKLTDENVAAVMTRVWNNGVRFFASGGKRDWVNQWRDEQQNQVAEAEAGVAEQEQQLAEAQMNLAALRDNAGMDGLDDDVPVVLGADGANPFLVMDLEEPVAAPPVVQQPAPLEDVLLNGTPQEMLVRQAEITGGIPADVQPLLVEAGFARTDVDAAHRAGQQAARLGQSGAPRAPRQPTRPAAPAQPAPARQPVPPVRPAAQPVPQTVATVLQQPDLGEGEGDFDPEAFFD